jgi:phosphoenolpyruvate carboxylase
MLRPGPGALLFGWRNPEPRKHDDFGDTRSCGSIDARNPYVDPINLLQIELLRWMRGGDDDPALRDAFVVTVEGSPPG